MQVRVFVTNVFPLETVTTKSGKTFTKYHFLGSTDEKFPKIMYFGFFNPQEGHIPPVPNATYDVSFDVESRCYNDKTGTQRWSTDVNAWKVTPVQQPQFAVPQSAQTMQPVNAQQQTSPNVPQNSVNGTLPF